MGVSVEARAAVLFRACGVISSGEACSQLCISSRGVRRLAPRTEGDRPDHRESHVDMGGLAWPRMVAYRFWCWLPSVRKQTERTGNIMVDELRRSIESRLRELLAEAERLRNVLAALGPDGASSRTAASARRSRGRKASGAAIATRTRASSAKRGTTSASRSASVKRGARPAAAARGRARTAPGATKRAVLKTLASGDAMTAGEVANATGLGRASVSTTLSKLSKAGEVTKAARGYKLAA